MLMSAIKDRGAAGANRGPTQNTEFNAVTRAARGWADNLVPPSDRKSLWMVAGENWGILDDDPPANHHIDARSHIADQIEMQGMTWKTYQESMGQPCGLTSRYPYEPKHNPFIYFDDINGWDGTKFQPSARCNDHVVDYSQFEGDLASG